VRSAPARHRAAKAGAAGRRNAPAHERLRQTVSSLQESLDYLRLSIKYLVFDLEATRRENGYLRKMLKRPADGNGIRLRHRVDFNLLHAQASFGTPAFVGVRAF